MKKFNKKSVIHCVISVNVLGSICLCPDLHCFLWLRKWTRLKLNISKLGGSNIFPSISSLPQSAWALTVFKRKIFLQMEGKKWFSDYWVSRPTKKDFSNLEIEKKIFWLVFSSNIFHGEFYEILYSLNICTEEWTISV